MPWKEVTVVSEREDFARLAIAPDANISQLCSRFGISRKTGYKYIDRFRREGFKGLEDRSRRPKNSPKHTPDDVEQVVKDMREEHPAWGGRKIKRRLLDLGHSDIPSASTITEILRRNNMLEESECRKHSPYERFEREAPNELWQMDFKGAFATDLGLCHSLTAVDDHSRFALLLKACPDQKTETVKEALIWAFERYGLPAWMLMDNGSPWSGGGRICLHLSHSLAYPAGNQCDAWPPLPSADAGKGRTLSRNVGSRGIALRTLQRPGGLPASL